MAALGTSDLEGGRGSTCSHSDSGGVDIPQDIATRSDGRGTIDDNSGCDATGIHHVMMKPMVCPPVPRP